MSAHPHYEPHVPREILIAAAVLITVSIGVAAAARTYREPEPPVSAEARVVMLRFEDRPDGSVVALDPASGRELLVAEPGTDGFVRGVLRGMFRTRRLESIDLRAPFRLRLEPDGRFLLEDPESGRLVELRSFGPTNYEAFVRIFTAAESAGRAT